jgi:DNA polymerase III epsilon subunit-like protein
MEQTMPALDVTEEQLVSLFSQLNSEQRKRVFDNILPLVKSKESISPKKPVFGGLKKSIVYIAPDFDAPLEDMAEYTE